MGSIHGLGRPPKGGHGNPLQYSCLENPKDRGAWQATIHRGTKSWAWLKQLSICTHTAEWKLSLTSSSLLLVKTSWGVVFSNGVISDFWRSLQLLSHVRLFATPWTAAGQASLSITNSQSLLKLLSIELVMPSTTSSSGIPFSSCLQSFPVLESFQMRQFFADICAGLSASTSVLPMNTQDSFPLGWTVWTSLQSQEFSPTPQFKRVNSLVLSFLYSPTLTSIPDYWKTIALARWTLLAKWCLCFLICWLNWS